MNTTAVLTIQWNGLTYNFASIWKDKVEKITKDYENGKITFDEYYDGMEDILENGTWW